MKPPEKFELLTRDEACRFIASALGLPEYDAGRVLAGVHQLPQPQPLDDFKPKMYRRDRLEAWLTRAKKAQEKGDGLPKIDITKPASPKALSETVQRGPLQVSPFVMRY